MSQPLRAHGPSKGIDEKIANDVLDQLKDYVQQKHPDWVSTTQSVAFKKVYGNDDELSQKLVVNFLKHADLAPLANLLSLPENQVKNCLRVRWIVINLKTEAETHIPHASDTLDVLTIVAIGPSTYETGLCALGSNLTHFNLSSGQALHTSTAEQQKFSGKGNSYLLLLGWKRP